MSRTKPEKSKAKLRDAELADAEIKLQEAREQLQAVKAEISRSYQLLGAISVDSQAAETEAVGFSDQFDGAIASFALAERANDRMPDGSS